MATSGRDITEQDRERIRRLREAGLSIRQIAKEERVSTTTVQKNLKETSCKVTQS